jgi:hypothetical protein
MPDYVITEQGEIDGLPFGTSRKSLRERLGEHTEFERVPGRVIDHYVDLGLQLNFDEDDRLGYVTVAEPAQVRLSGIALLGRPLGEVRDDLAGAGLDPVVDEDGITIEEPSVVLWSAAADEPAEPIEAVAVGNPDLG